MAKKIIVSGGGVVSSGRADYVAKSKVGDIEQTERRLFNSHVSDLTRHKATQFLGAGERPMDGELSELIFSLDREDFNRLGSNLEEQKDAMREIIREGLGNLWNELGVRNVRYAAGIHLNTNNPHAHILFMRDALSIETGEYTRMPKIPRQWFWREGGENSKLGSLFEKALVSRTIATPPKNVVTKLPIDDQSVKLPHAETHEARIENTLARVSQLNQISPQWMEGLVDNGSLYLSRQGSLTFVRRDDKGHTTGYVYENGYQPTETKGFFYIGDPNTASRFIIVDTAKEALAALELTGHRDLSDVCFVASDKNAAPAAFTNLLLRRSEETTLRVIWALSLDRNGVQDQNSFVDLQSSLLENRTETAPPIEFFTWAPKQGYGRTWSNQLQFRNLPGELNAIMKKVLVADERLFDSIDHDVTEEYDQKAANILGRLDVESSHNEFIVSSKTRDGEAIEYGRFRILETDFNEQQFVISSVGDRSVDAEFYDDELDVISAIESRFLDHIERELTQPDPAAEIEPQNDVATSTETVDAKQIIDRTAAAPRLSAKELTERLKEIPLEDVMPRLGLQLTYDKERREYIYRDRGQLNKIKVKGDLWCDRYDDNRGGRNPINLVMHVEGKSFADARAFLLDNFGTDYIPEQRPQKVVVSGDQGKIKALFVMPEPNDEKLERAYHYLTNERAIAPEIVDMMIDRGFVFANSFGSCVFVNKDEHERVLGASWRAIQGTKRGDYAGTEKVDAWFYIGDPKTASKFIITESPIEAMSYYQLHGDRIDLNSTAIISTATNSVPLSLVKLLQKNAGENAELVIAYNNDKRGQEGAYFLLEKIGRLGMLKHRSHFENGLIEASEFTGSVTLDIPEMDDWNEDLKAVRELDQYEADNEHVAEEIDSLSRPDLLEKKYEAIHLTELAITEMEGWHTTIDGNQIEFPYSFRSFTSLDQFLKNARPFEGDYKAVVEMELSDGSSLITPISIGEGHPTTLQEHIAGEIKADEAALAQDGFESDQLEEIKDTTAAYKYVLSQIEIIQAKEEESIAADYDQEPDQEYLDYEPELVSIVKIPIPASLKHLGRAEILLAKDNDEQLEVNVGYRFVTGDGTFEQWPTRDGHPLSEGRQAFSEAYSRLREALQSEWNLKDSPAFAASKIGENPGTEEFLAFLLDKTEINCRQMGFDGFEPSFSILPELSDKDRSMLENWRDLTKADEFYKIEDIFAGGEIENQKQRNLMYRLVSAGFLETQKNGLHLYVRGFDPLTAAAGKLIEDARHIENPQPEQWISVGKDPVLDHEILLAHPLDRGYDLTAHQIHQAFNDGYAADAVRSTGFSFEYRDRIVTILDADVQGTVAVNFRASNSDDKGKTQNYLIQRLISEGILSSSDFEKMISFSRGIAAIRKELQEQALHLDYRPEYVPALSGERSAAFQIASKSAVGDFTLVTQWNEPRVSFGYKLSHPSIDAGVSSDSVVQGFASLGDAIKELKATDDRYALIDVKAEEAEKEVITVQAPIATPEVEPIEDIAVPISEAGKLQREFNLALAEAGFDRAVWISDANEKGEFDLFLNEATKRDHQYPQYRLYAPSPEFDEWVILRNNYDPSKNSKVFDFEMTDLSYRKRSSFISASVSKISKEHSFISSIPTLLRSADQEGRIEKRMAKILHAHNIGDEIAGAEEFHVRLENAPYMDLHISKDYGTNLIRFTHYYEQNGDLMHDGEMNFRLDDTGRLKLNQVAAAMYGVPQYSHDRSFANMFSTNLMQQGFEKATLIRSELNKEENELTETAETIQPISDSVINTPPMIEDAELAIEQIKESAEETVVANLISSAKTLQNELEDLFKTRDLINPWKVVPDHESNILAIGYKEESNPDSISGPPLYALWQTDPVDEIWQIAIGEVIPETYSQPEDFQFIEAEDLRFEYGSAVSNLFTQFLLPETNTSANRVDAGYRHRLALEQEPSGVLKGTISLATDVREMLHAGLSIGNNIAYNELSESHFGGTRAAGDYTARDAFDALEMGVNLYLIDQGRKFIDRPEKEVLSELRQLLKRLPTQTDRTDEQQLFQQFSTVPTESFAAFTAAGIRPDDIVLEPSAGNGGLAIWPRLLGLETHVNEITDRRAGILRIIGFNSVSRQDAQFLNDTLNPEIKPTCIIMNPPFSATGGRTKNKTRYGSEHITDALTRLAPGGRLVAIAGEGMSFERPTFTQWWSELMAKYNVRANIGVSGDEYSKYGTTFGNQIIVIDKTGATPGETLEDRFDSVISGNYQSLEEVLEITKEIGSDRKEILLTAKTIEKADTSDKAEQLSARRPLILPETITLTPSLVELYDEHYEQLKQIGFETIKLSNGVVAIKTVPESITPENALSVFADLINEPKKIEAFLDAERSTEISVNSKIFTNVEYSDFISRKDVQRQSAKFFIFGDNLEERGFGGQAMDMRGEPNAIGIPTKKSPSRKPEAYFSDTEFDVNQTSIDRAFTKLEALSRDTNIVLPKAGIGTGLAELETRAPRTFEYLQSRFRNIGLFVQNEIAEVQQDVNHEHQSSQDSVGTDNANSFGNAGKQPSISKTTDHVDGSRRTNDAGQFSLFDDDSGRVKSDPASQADRPFASAASSDTGENGGNDHQTTGIDNRGDHAGTRTLEPEISTEVVEDLLGVGKNTAKRQRLSGLGVISYKPAKLTKGVEHPGDIVESSSMAAVDPPDITYTPKLSAKVIKEGLLSSLQLETVIYAGQRHESFLPDGSRAGYFIGDGTGVGKGRELSGIAVDNWNHGRKRVLWLSINYDLVPSAERDLNDLDAKHIPLSSLDKHSIHADLNEAVGDSILFGSYATLIGKGKDGKTRFDQIVDWLGEDGVIMFDEGHLAKNAVSFGQSEASQRGEAVVELQVGEKSNPNWRFVYSSATGATELRNMAYMQRLGLWGDGTGFPGGFVEFHNTIDRGGIGAMEMVARDMKAAGMYMSRSLSFRGVNYRQVHHQLTPEQKEIYNISSRAWSSVVLNFDEALKQTSANGRTRAFAFSRLWSSQQLFYRQLVTALKVPALIQETERMLEKGSDYTDPATGETINVPAKIIIGVIGTGEARTKDQVSKAMQLGLDLDSLDFSPKQILMNVVEGAFPTKRFTEKLEPLSGRTIKVPVVDKDGRHIESQEAILMRDMLLAELNERVVLPDNPLDQIINYFGDNAVGEITGRDKRIIIDPETGVRNYVKRARPGVAMDKASQDEMNAFQMNSKRTAIISQSASTGISLDADLRPQLKKYVIEGKITQDQSNEMFSMWKRDASVKELLAKANDLGIQIYRDVHATLETSWSADVQMQTFGRSHRSSQWIQPEYVLISTDLGGEKRFLSTIAKRLSSLGALTKGDRDQAGGGDLLQYDFENKYGEEAAKKIVTMLRDDKPALMTLIPNDPVSGNERSGLAMLYSMGLAKKDGEILSVSEDTIKTLEVSRFLNRVLMLDVDTQNAVFDAFTSEMESIIHHDKELGLFDEGVRDVEGENIRFAADPRVVTTDKATGANTMYYQLHADTPTHPVTLEEIALRNQTIRINGISLGSKSEEGVFYQQTNSKNIVYVEYTSSRVDAATGQMRRFYKYARPSGWQTHLLSETDLMEKYTPVRRDQNCTFKDDLRMKVESWWKQEVETTPATQVQTYHLIAGAVLPVWQRLSSSNEAGNQMSLKTVRIETEEGERVVGVQIPPSHISRVLRDLGVDRSFKTPDEIFNAVMETRDTIDLVGGIKLKHAFLKKQPLIQIMNLSPYQQNEFKNYGALKEIIGFEAKYFIPNEPEKGIEVLGKILERYPAVDSGATEEKPEEKQGEDAETLRETVASAINNLTGTNRFDDGVLADLGDGGSSFAEKAALLRNKPLSAYWWMMKADVNEKGQVLLSPAAYEFARVAYRDSMRIDVENFDGLFNDGNTADRFFEALDQRQMDAGIYAESIESMISSLAQAREIRQDGVLVLLTDEESGMHEELHVASHIASAGRNLRDRHARFEELVATEAYSTAKPILVRKYGTDNDAILIEETWAKCASGKADGIGLTPEAAADFTELWFRSFAEKNGSMTKEQFKELTDESRTIRDNAYRSITAERVREHFAGSNYDREPGTTLGTISEWDNPGRDHQAEHQERSSIDTAVLYDIDRERGPQGIEPLLSIEEKAAVLLGQKIIADARVAHSEYELTSLEANVKEKEYEVSISGNSSEKRAISLAQLERERKAYAVAQVDNDLRTGILANKAEERELPLRIMTEKFFMDSVDRAEKLQAPMIRSINSQVEEETRSLAAELANALSARQEIQAQLEDHSNNSPDLNLNAIMPVIEPEYLWGEQLKAALRNDAELFRRLEDLHQNNNIPRPNDVFARLRGVELIKNLEQSIADRSQTHKSDPDETLILDVSPEAADLHIEGHRIKNPQYGDLIGEYDEVKKEAKKQRHAGRKSLLQPLINKLSPLSPVQGSLSWITNPAATFKAHLHPLEVIKNDPAVQIVRSVWNYFEHRAKAGELEAEAANILKEAEGLNSISLADMSEASENIAAQIEDAVSNEELIRSGLAKDEFANQNLLRTPERALTDEEVRFLGKAAGDLGDSELLDKYHSLLESDPEIMENAERMGTESLLADLRASDASIKAIKNVSIGEDGLIEIELDPAAMVHARNLIRTADIAGQWQARLNGQLANMDVGLKDLESIDNMSNLIESNETVSAFVSEQYVQAGDAIARSFEQPLSQNDLELLERMTFTEQIEDQFAQLAHNEIKLDILQAQAEAATKGDIMLKNVGQNLTLTNPNQEMEANAKKFWQQDRELREKEIMESKLKRTEAAEVQSETVAEMELVEAAEAAEAVEGAEAAILLA